MERRGTGGEQLLVWLVSSVLGVVAAVAFGSLGLMVGASVLVLELLLLLPAGRATAISGVLVGFGGTWLTLLVAQSASGGVVSGGSAAEVAWSAVGVIAIAIGALIATWLVMARRRSTPASRQDLPR